MNPNFQVFGEVVPAMQQDMEHDGISGKSRKLPLTEQDVARFYREMAENDELSDFGREMIALAGN
ncbi:MAG: hypothetical protein K2P57_10150 [Burkholderiales bacterium]|nr:hypothetical protein [Burkholderiales bacterium]